MKQLAGIIVFMVALTQVGSAKDRPWQVSLIADSMKQDAHAIVRYYDEGYVITGPGEYILNKKRVVTVLDEKGAMYGDMNEASTRYATITDVVGNVYDRNGVQVKSLRGRDILEVAGVGHNFIDDIKLEHHSFNYGQYPYTTEYDMEIKVNSTFFLPAWEPIMGDDCPTEAASIKIEYPNNFPLRYRAVKLPTPSVIKGAENTVLSLYVAGLKSAKSDDFTLMQDLQDPMLQLAADTFHLFDHRGGMTTWHDLGQFFYTLNKNRDVLTPEIKTMVHRISDTCHSNKQKIAVLYKYLQDNTRYVSIQLGIGGWQTFDAKFVGTKKYGDCKALSNFMKAMLSEAGVTAYCVLVSAGTKHFKRLTEDFPSNAFNHVILCVPEEHDTTWLECTSHDLPAGYLGDFTCDRKVLLCTGEGGVVLRTPVYGKDMNMVTRKAQLALNSADELTGDVIQNFRGSYWQKEMSATATKSNATEHLGRSLSFANYTVAQPTISNYSQTGAPELREEFKATATTEVVRSGNNLILSTAVFPLSSIVTSRTDTVHPQFQLYNSSTIADTVVIALNGDYEPSQPLNDVNYDYPFGSYHLRYELVNKNKLIKTSVYTINAGIYPAEQFANYRTLKNNALAAARKKLVFTKL